MKQKNRNRVQCNKCKSVIESTHVHDFVTCLCRHVSVDGGRDYFRRAWEGEADYTEMP